MDVINSIFTSKWGLGRWLRLLIGIAFIVDAFYKESGLVGFMGAFLAYQALFNLGCASGSCAIDNETPKSIDISGKIKQIDKNV